MQRSDVVRMAWSHIEADKKIVVAQQKTGRRLVIPLHRDLLSTLAAEKRAHVSILTTVYGRPFSVDGFSQWMRHAITAAGLPLDCQPHGLRKATGRRLAESGATAKMIMSILGHTTLAEAERYTEEADQVGLAEDAVVRLEGHKANKHSQTTPREVWECFENERRIKMLGTGLALPREAREANNVNGLRKSLGRGCPIEFQHVSVPAPKPLRRGKRRFRHRC